MSLKEIHRRQIAEILRKKMNVTYGHTTAAT